MSTLDGIIQIIFADVPATDVEVYWVDHGKEFLDWLEDIGERTVLFAKVETNVGGGTLGERAVEVGLHFSGLGHPSESLLIGEEAGGEGGAVVTTETDEHDTELGNALVSSDNFFLNNRSGLLLLSIVKREAVLVDNLEMSLGLGTLNTGEGGSGLDFLELEGAFGGRGDDGGLFHLKCEVFNCRYFK